MCAMWVQARLYSMHGQALPRSFLLGAEAAKERITDAAIYGDGLVALTGGFALTLCCLEPLPVSYEYLLCFTGDIPLFSFQLCCSKQASPGAGAYRLWAVTNPEEPIQVRADADGRHVS